MKRAILTIDTSTTVCSLALVSENGVEAERIDTENNNHSKVIGVFAKELLEEAKALGLEICAAAISQGPGSYTGLRIGTSFAKGFCYGNSIPLIAIPTLKIMASSVAEVLKEHGITNALLCPMIDARRMEVYSALYDTELNEVEAVNANIINEDSYKERLESQHVYFFGNGSTKCISVIKSQNATFVEDIDPLATDMGPLAWDAFNANNFVDVAYFEPFYLKEYVAVVSKNKVFNF